MHLMSREWFLFLAEDLSPEELKYLPGARLGDHPNGLALMSKTKRVSLGTGASTAGMEFVPESIRTVTGMLSTLPRLLDEELMEQILQSLKPAGKVPGFDAPTGFVARPEIVRPFLQEHLGRKISYFSY
jgi:hypothetical protein